MRRHSLFLVLPLIATTVSCDEHTTTGSPPSFQVPSLNIPTTPPATPSSDDLPISGEPPGPPIANPVVPHQPHHEALKGQLPVDPPTRDGALPRGDENLAAVESVTGPAGVPGGPVPVPPMPATSGCGRPTKACRSTPAAVSRLTSWKSTKPRIRGSTKPDGFGVQPADIGWIKRINPSERRSKYNRVRTCPGSGPDLFDPGPATSSAQSTGRWFRV